MSEKRLLAATRIVRNSIVLFMVAAMAKGFGLVIAVIIARFLGAEALGIYAVLFALTMILEIVTPLGQQDVVIREVAREPASMRRIWAESGVTAFAMGLLFSLALAVGSRILGVAPDVQRSVDVVAISLPFGAASLVAQSVLQGLERLHYLAIATFVARVVSIVVLAAMLLAGTGVVAAFVCRLSFHVLTLVMLAFAISRHGQREGLAEAGRVALPHLKRRITVAMPFAAQRVLNEASARGTVLVLPFLISMQSVGLFDAADRIRQTAAMIIPIVMLSILPAFSRTFRADRQRGALLANYSMKFLLIGILPMAMLLASLAPWVIALLYGNGYEESVPVLRIVIWAQVFLSADMILKQALIASDNELAMLRRTAAGLLIQIAMTVTFVSVLGTQGVAVAILVSSVIILALDAHFVWRHVVELDFLGAAAKPGIATAIATVVALALPAEHAVIAAIAALLTYLVALLALRTFSADEMLLIRGIPGRLLRKQG